MNLEIVALHITPNVVLDIGCHKGDWHNQARLLWPNAHFMLVDANPANLTAIQATGAEHYIAVLADEEKEVTFYTRKDDQSGCTGDGIYKENTPWYSDENVLETKVQATTLDNLLRDKLPLYGPILAKLDVQGAELDILKGAPDILPFIDAIICEVSLIEYNQGAPRFNVVEQYIKDQGFALAAHLGTIFHPLNHLLAIQQDMLYLRK
jgi:FkbM family methyltransferase